MSERKRYRKRADLMVTAVRLDLDTDGFTYRKLGELQTCKAGDWLVNNQGETYTVDAQSFAASYREVSPGVYFKHGEVWAAVAEHDGVIPSIGRIKPILPDFPAYPQRGHQPRDCLWVGISTRIPATKPQHSTIFRNLHPHSASKYPPGQWMMQPGE